MVALGGTGGDFIPGEVQNERPYIRAQFSHVLALMFHKGSVSSVVLALADFCFQKPLHPFMVCDSS